jgi:hypothetical protein
VTKRPVRHYQRVFGLRTMDAVAENDGQDFGVQCGREAPMRFRLGARYKY